MKNTILDYLKGCDGELYGRIVRTLKVYRGIDFEDIRQEDVMVVSPDKAMKYGGEEGDKYFKVWMAGERIAWCTWANTLVDSKFRWNAKARGENKRDNSDLLGNEPYVSAYLKSYDAVKECSTVYMFPFAAFGKKEEKAAANDNMGNGAKTGEEKEADDEVWNETLAQPKRSNFAGFTKTVKGMADDSRRDRRLREMDERTQLEQVLSMRLNDTDPEELVRELMDLGVRINAAGAPMRASRFRRDEMCSAMRGKFRNGLVTLKRIDPQNGAIKELAAMQRRWTIKAYRPWIVWGAAFAAMVILSELGMISIE